MNPLIATLASALIALVGITVSEEAEAPAHTANNPQQGTVVQLRVEGATKTIFEAPVSTTPHDVMTLSAGTRRCDGTNNNANPRPGPTTTGALDDGARAGSFTWDGTYWTEFDNIFITRIADDAQTSTQFWGILLNGQFTDVGGCQQQLRLGNEVLYAFDVFNKTHTLKLVGPAGTRVSQPTKYRVTDARTGAPIAGASVNGSTTDANGEASLTFSAIGVVNVKADRPDSIRSNAVVTAVAP